MKTSLLLFILFDSTAAFSIHAGDFWFVVKNTGTFQSLDLCSKTCISNVNSSLANGEDPCVAYGCVCTPDTSGKNYIQGLANIKDCAVKSGCSDPSRATTGFADICAIYSAGITQPVVLTNTTVLEITGPGYDKLESCGKWCLNGCLDSNGTRLENCGPNFYPPNWGDFHGLAADQDCSTPDCMCNAANFDSAVAKLIESSRGFCGWPVSKPQAPFPPYDNMHSVFVNWCLRMGYAHHNYTAVIVGAAPVGNFSVANGTSGSTNTTTANTVVLVKSWSSQEILAAVVGIIALIAAIGTFALQGVKFWRE